MNVFKKYANDPYVIFIVFIIVVANALQPFSVVPIHTDGNYVDYFTALILWLLSFTSLRLAIRPGLRLARRLFWVAAFFGLAALACDEVFAFHETLLRRDLSANDDYFKAVMWLAAGAALYVTVKLEDPAVPNIRLILVGYALHSVHMVSEVVTERSIPFIVENLPIFLYAEEIIEISFLSVYLIAFKNILEREARAETYSLR